MTTCYLLGAGASYGNNEEWDHYQRPPLGNSLFEVGWDRGILQWQDFSPLVQKISEYKGINKDVEQMEPADFRMDNTEKFLGHLNQKFNNQKRTEIGEYMVPLSLAYYYIFELFRQQCIGYSPKDDNYSRMAEFLGENSGSVITLNYDLLLEIALDTKGSDYHYSIFENQTGTPLMKLHGSINWCSKGAGTITQAGSFPKAVQSTHSNSLHFPIKHLNYNWLSNNTYRSFVHGFRDTHEPTLLPPFDEHKNYQKTQIYDGVWENTTTLLENATEVVIIGCSLNPSDNRLRRLLQNNTDPSTSFTIVTPSPSNISDRLHDIFTNPNIAQKIGGNEAFSEYTEEVF